MNKSILLLILLTHEHNLLISCNKPNHNRGVNTNTNYWGDSTSTRNKAFGNSNTKNNEVNDKEENESTEKEENDNNKNRINTNGLSISDASSNGNTGIGSVIAILLKKHILSPERILFLTRIGLLYVLTTELWKSTKNAWEDWIDDIESTTSSSSLYEDHDQPFFKPGSIIGLQNHTDSEGQEGKEDGKEGDKSNVNKRDGGRRGGRGSRRGSVGVTSYARDLAIRLHSCGVPLDNSNNNKDQESNNDSNSESATVYSILSSLTKTEGQILSNCLLAPSPVMTSSSSKDNNNNNPILWNTIAGLSHVQESLMDILYTFLNPQQLASNNNYSSLLSSISTNGILLYGPPGTGKTMLAKALAQSTNMRFLSISPSSLLRKYVGETNLYIKALFSLAKKIQPCIIFIDEMDGLFRERSTSVDGSGSSSEHDVSRDLKTEFMSLWDGIHSKNDKVLIIGATNRPFDIDSAFLRRMSRSFYITLPNYESRLQFLYITLSNGNVPLEQDFDYGYIATLLDGYSPSDMKQVLHTAALIPLREARNVVKGHGHYPHHNNRAPSVTSQLPPLRKLTTQDVITAKENVPPTQWSKSYRMLLADYANRVNFGIAPYKDLSLQQPQQQKSSGYAFDQFTNEVNNDNDHVINSSDSSSNSEYDVYDEDEEYGHDDDTDDTDDYLQ